MKCYKCRNELPTGSKSCPSCGQPVYTTAASPGAGYGRRLDGCLPETRSPSDYTAVPNLSTLPPRADLRPGCSPVEDQGQLGSCTANAVVGALEFKRRKAGRQEDLSRLFVYYNARKLLGRESEDSGALIAHGMAALLAYGVPPESAWPYDPAKVTVAPPNDIYGQAWGQGDVEYARVDGIEHVKGALARDQPVVFSISIPERCYYAAEKNGIVPDPTEEELAISRSQHGRHSMLLVGYDSDASIFHVRNSWGRAWGDQGYCRMSVETFERALAVGTTWILGSLEASGAFSVVRPAAGTGTAARPTPSQVDGSVRDKAAAFRDEIRSGVTKDIGDALKDIKQRVTPRQQG
jgi:hypothetical protein